jgi:hypothetical protein
MSADNPNSTDTPAPPPPVGAFDPANPIPGQAIQANGGQFYYLGDNPTTGAPLWSSFVSAKSGAIVISGRLVDPETGTVIADFSNPSGGSGGGISPTTAYSEQQANARDAASLAQNQQQYQSTQDMQRAINDQQFALSQGTLTGTYGGAPTENARQFDQGQALNYYKYLSDVVANPRNIMQSLFQIRGQPAPAGSGQFSNVNTLQQFNAPQLRIQGQTIGYPSAGPSSVGGPAGALSSAGTAAGPSAPPGFVAPSYANPAAAAGRVQQALGPGVSWAAGNLAGFDKSGMPLTTGAPSQLGGGSPLLPGQTEDPTFQAFRQNVANNALGGNVTQEQAMNPKAVGPNGLAIYKKGGVMTETVVGKGTTTGKGYVFNENPRKPEGIVPASYLPKFLQQRHGQQVGGQKRYAIGGVIGDNTDPYLVDPYAGGSPTLYGPAPGTGSGPLPSGYDPTYSSTPIDYSTTTYNGVNAPPPTSPTPIPTATTDPTTTTISGVSAYGTPGGYSAPTTTAPAPTNTNPFSGPVSAPVSAPAPTGYVSPMVQQPAIQQPLGTPQASHNFTATGAPGPGLTPGAVSPAGTFGNLSGNMPQFLPGEDNGGAIGQLIASGYLPPFLSRTLAQARGVQSQGTNQPQALNLPGGLPLVSRLNELQMSPSEKSAFESLISASGIDPTDYWAYVDSLAPQGGTASFAPAFGNSFGAYRQ